MFPSCNQLTKWKKQELYQLETFHMKVLRFSTSPFESSPVYRCRVCWIQNWLQFEQHSDSVSSISLVKTSPANAIKISAAILNLASDKPDIDSDKPEKINNSLRSFWLLPTNIAWANFVTANKQKAIKAIFTIFTSEFKTFDVVLNTWLQKSDMHKTWLCVVKFPVSIVLNGRSLALSESYI